MITKYKEYTDYKIGDWVKTHYHVNFTPNNKFKILDTTYENRYKVTAYPFRSTERDRQYKVINANNLNAIISFSDISKKLSKKESEELDLKLQANKYNL